MSSKVLPELDIKEMSHCPIYYIIIYLFEAILNSPLVCTAWVFVMFQCGLNHVSQPVPPYHATFSSQRLLQTGILQEKTHFQFGPSSFQCQDVFNLR